MTLRIPPPQRSGICVAGMLAWAVAGLLALSPLPAEAQWKWRDANGRVTASDRPPPPGIADKDILQRPGSTAREPMPPPSGAGARDTPAAAAAASAPTRSSDPELEARKRKAEDDAAARKKADEQTQAANRKAEDERVAAAKADNCQRARGALRALEDGVRIARTKPDGEREFLNDAQRATETHRVRGVIASDCR
jgi:hypothetical protein